jgi:hypothetical protein
MLNPLCGYATDARAVFDVFEHCGSSAHSHIPANLHAFAHNCTYTDPAVRADINIASQARARRQMNEIAQHAVVVHTASRVQYDAAPNARIRIYNHACRQESSCA